MFLTCWTSYEADADGRLDTTRSGDRVKVPVRRISLLRQLGLWRITVVETVNGRCYYLPGTPDDVERSLEGGQA